MRCPNCKTENPSGKKFCGDCGAALANPCPKCGADNPAGKSFCGECGTALRASAAAATERKSDESPIRVAETPAGENLEGERQSFARLAQTSPLRSSRRFARSCSSRRQPARNLHRRRRGLRPSHERPPRTAAAAAVIFSLRSGSCSGYRSTVSCTVSRLLT